MKKTLSFLLVVTLLLSSFSVVYANPDDKNGFDFYEVNHKTVDIDVNPEFVLTTPYPISLDDAKMLYSTDSSVILNVSEISDTEFSVSPTDALKYNTMYLFKLPLDSGEVLSWAFQTCKRFTYTSTYPMNASTNVPVNTGIEFTLSYGGLSEYEDKFSISPQVDGRFELHESTVSFIPSKPLDFQTVYTVSVSSGIKAENGLVTDENFSFSFETEYENEVESENYNLDIASLKSSYTTQENPTFELYCDGIKSVGYTIYKFKSNDSAFDAMTKKISIPSWVANYNLSTHIDTSNLTKIASDTVSINPDEWETTFEYSKKLNEGYYLIEAVGNGVENPAQEIFNISDMGVVCCKLENQSVIWVNDMISEKAIENAVISCDNGTSAVTDSNGLAQIDTENSEYISIEHTGRKLFLAPKKSYVSPYYQKSSSNIYHKVLKLDRSLYKKDDTVYFSGYIKKRNGDAVNSLKVTVEGSSYSSNQICAVKYTNVNNNTYNGDIKLADLDNGYYYLKVYDGETMIAYQSFSVKKYVKPDYKLSITPSVKAVFANEPLDFTVNASFFDNTPVSELDISYSESFGSKYTNDNKKADINGDIHISANTESQADMNGIEWYRISAETTLPEKGRISASASVPVAVNDIMADTDISYDGNNVNLSTEVNYINLDNARLNGNISRDNIKGAPVANKPVQVEIFKRYYEKVNDGTFYSYIEKKTCPKYRYIAHVDSVSSFTLTANDNGIASTQFALKANDNEYYYATVTVKDSNGRSIKNEYGIYNSSRYYPSDTPYLHLDIDKEAYLVGDTVSASVKYGDEKPTNVKTLFIKSQSDIQKVLVSSDNEYNFTFGENDIPNCYIYAISLAGDGYHDLGSLSAELDRNSRQLNIDIKTDKESYAPGDTCTVSVTTYDNDGNSKPSHINISAVDEALLALSDYSPETLYQLFSPVSRIYPTVTMTHGESRIRMYGSNMASGGSVAMESAKATEDSAFADTNIRDDFRDTALFADISTNENGFGEYTFTLPDNTTSWRLIVSAVSDDLYAGDNTSNIIAGLPMFINYTMSETYLVGDVPSVGVNAYGNELESGENITFEIYDPNNTESIIQKQGKAFERTNIPIWSMDFVGEYELIIRAVSDSGKSDAVKVKYNVTDTYRSYPYSEYVELYGGGQTFSVNDAKSMVRIRFTEGKNGRMLSQLFGLRFNCRGERLEKVIVRDFSAPFMNSYLDYDLSEEKTDISEYQASNGGLKILPNSESDVETTAKLIPFVKDYPTVDMRAIKDYLNDVYYGEGGENKAAALYGLSLLGAPVLGELEKYKYSDDADLLTLGYTGLAYSAIGDLESAAELYEKMTEFSETQGIYKYIPLDTKDDSLKASSVALLLALSLGLDDAEGYFNYCIDNKTSEYLLITEELAYICKNLNLSDEKIGSALYNLWGEDKTADLNTCENLFVKLPVSELSALSVTSCDGDICALISYDKSIVENDMYIDDKVTVSRKFYLGNTEEEACEFRQGDIIRVELSVEYADTALDGSYMIYEYMPSGLSYVPFSAKLTRNNSSAYPQYIYAQLDGKRILFHDYKPQDCINAVYSYYMRVTSPGIYKAEGATVQNIKAGSFSLGADDIIKIDE